VDRRKIAGGGIMKTVKIYTTNMCPFCVMAKKLLSSKGVEYVEINIENDIETRQRLMEETGLRTVPQIWIGDEHVGGYQELAKLESQRVLDGMLA
jgi:glutaredoxin 3